ncbi:MAG: PSD1 and planctomycete cytochrome C domain-containing protein [Verrucomicrobiota bacterium]
MRTPTIFKNRIAHCCCAVLVALASSGLRAEEAIQFNRDIRPLLSDRCFQCHGPDEHERKATLRLDETDGSEGAYRTDGGTTILKPGSPAESELWHRILSEDPDEVMPPPEASKKPLSAAEKDLIKRWIEEGAPYEDFWAFVPPDKSLLPQTENTLWSQRPIDRFVLRKLESEGLSPQPPADRRTLIRRTSFDLTGLPPTPEEIETFLSDTSPDAYETLVDRLLAKQHFGEHMTKYWLDLVRFADTNGIHHDHFRDLTPYRDWVIRAFNDNLSYKDFLTYQLAGDLYPDATRDQLIASGFNRLHLIIDVGTALPEESYTRNVIDRVTAVGTAFMGLTVQCAVCHDHKYDPITAKDFFQLFAFFNNLDAKPETGGRSGSDFKRGLQVPYINLTSPANEARIQKMEAVIAEANRNVRALKEKAKSIEEETASEETKAELKKAEDTLKKARADKDRFMVGIPGAMIMKEKADIRPAHILVRGAYDNPGEVVGRGTPAFLPELKTGGDQASRMDLANWFTSPENPLTARVAVNRFWQQLFGVGLVKTSEDFGSQGEWPSHPDLLDYLAVNFLESGWDVKALLKDIVLSETYQQSSKASPADYRRDPENRLLARGSRFRMDSEMIRDQILASSGLLNTDMFGKSVKPPQPEGLWKSVGMPSSYPREFKPDDGDQIYRRSVYTFWKRGMPPPQMTILNAPTREACIARRERTNTPLQALLLLNEQEYLKASRHLAAGLLERDPDPNERLDTIYETITSSLPDAKERATLLEAATDLTKHYNDNPELAKKLCAGVSLPEGISRADLAAWTLITSSIYNLDLTKTRQ